MIFGIGMHTPTTKSHYQCTIAQYWKLFDAHRNSPS